MKEVKLLAFKVLILLLILIPVKTMGQEVSVVKTEPVLPDIKGEVMTAALSPHGNSILITTAGYRGLYIFDLRDRKTTLICNDPGAGYKPAFSAGGEKIWYKSDDFSGMVRYSSMIEYDIPAAKSRIIESKARNLSPPQLVENSLIYSSGGRQKSEPSGLKSGEGSAYVMLEELVPVIYINGIRKVLKPNGDGNYIWASLSPDKTKLLYNYGGKSTFICDLNGNILAEAGRINAPEWLNNSMIVGMNDRDDGYRVISSDIVCYSLKTGKTTFLTSTTERAEMYPMPFTDGQRIIFQTVGGELYMMHLRIKN